MNYESGFGANGSPYEYEVAVAKNANIVLKRFCLCLLYVSWVVGFIVLGSVIRLIWPFLAFIPLSLWVIVYLTWKYTQISYRYSFFGGEMKVERLLGGRKNQPILSVKIKDLPLYIGVTDLRRKSLISFLLTKRFSRHPRRRRII